MSKNDDILPSSQHDAKLPVMRRNWPLGCLTEVEWRELLGLEYVLTWGYTNNEKEDEKRYMELSNRRWVSLYGA
jgi:hypothetical protein